MSRFDQVQFGKARAELEGAQYPELIEKGFLDHGGFINDLQSGDKFLVLGFKGSGKSILAEKLRIENKKSGDVVVHVVHLEDFPFKSFAKVFSGEAEPESKYPTSWSWILLLVLIDVMRHMDASGDKRNADFKIATDFLAEIGLLPTDDLKRVVIQSSKTSMKVQIPKIIEFCHERQSAMTGADLQFLAVVEHFKRMVMEFNTKKKIILVIDGLDDILSKRDVQYQALAALVFEVDRLNLLFSRNGVRVNIIILCRTELFERLPGPNKNKLRQDSAIEIDWYHDPSDARNSNLVALANLRAHISLGYEVDVFAKWFQKTIDGKDLVHFLIDNTRHTPRDFVQLLNRLKPYFHDKVFTRKQVIAGLRDYSMNYFLPEIRDELVGYVRDGVFDQFVEMLGEIRQREFPYRILSELAPRYSLDDDVLIGFLKSMYDCSAIGCKWRTPSGSYRYSFRFRNRNSSLDRTKILVLHKGLWKALNLV